MSDVKIYPAREINNFSVSVYSNKPEMHAYEHPDMVSVKVSDLFPGMPEAIYSHSGDDLKPTADSTREALKNIDMSRIKPGDSVNIMTCEHGFLMFGGLPYIEMVKTIKEEIERRTGAYDIRTKVVMYRTPREGDEVIDFYELKEHLGEVEAVSSYEKGVPIETRIGTQLLPQGIQGLHHGPDASGDPHPVPLRLRFSHRPWNCGYGGAHLRL